MITAIVFDFDGVLADSEVLHLRAYQEVLAPLGVGLSRADYYARYLGIRRRGGVQEVSRRIADSGSTSEDIAELIARKSVVFDALEASADMLFPAPQQCVRGWPRSSRSASRRARCGTRSRRSSNEAGLRRLLRLHRGVRRHAVEQAGAGSVPARRGAPRRPPGACVAIEDSRWGIESARAAGLACVGITQTYPRDELSAADRIIDSLDELTPTLIQVSSTAMNRSRMTLPLNLRARDLRRWPAICAAR